MKCRAILAALAVIALGGCGSSQQPAADSTAAGGHKPSTMQLTSSAFANGGEIPAEYTCDGAGRSPPLAWSQAPANTQSFALLVEDPDAPNGTFGHWGIYDIPASVHQLPAGASGSVVGGPKETLNDYGNDGYGPPCPPMGEPAHHYEFHLMALDTPQLSSLQPEATDLTDETQGHVLAEADLVATYKRG